MWSFAVDVAVDVVDLLTKREDSKFKTRVIHTEKEPKLVFN